MKAIALVLLIAALSFGAWMLLQRGPDAGDAARGNAPDATVAQPIASPATGPSLEPVGSQRRVADDASPSAAEPVAEARAPGAAIAAPWVDVEVLDARTREPIETFDTLEFVYLLPPLEGPPEPAPDPWSRSVGGVATLEVDESDPNVRARFEAAVIRPGVTRMPWGGIAKRLTDVPTQDAPWQLAVCVGAHCYRNGATPWFWFDGRSSYGPFTVLLEPGGCIAGVVRSPRGDPVPGAAVLLHRKLEPGNYAYESTAGVPARFDYERVDSIKCDAEGRFRLQVLVDGEYVLRAIGPDGARVEQTAAFDATAGAVTTRDVVLPDGGFVEGTGTRPDGNAIDAFDMVVAVRRDGFTSARFERSAGGRFLLGPLPPGRWRVSIGGIGFVDCGWGGYSELPPPLDDASAFDVDVRDGQTAHRDVDLRAPRGTVLYGTVRVDGGLEPGVRVSVEAAGEDPPAALVPYGCQPDSLSSAGDYRFVDLPPGPLRLTLSRASRTIVAEDVYLAAGVPLRRDFDLRLARCRGRLVAAHGERPPPLDLELVDAYRPNGEPLRRSSLPTDDRGLFELRDVPVGLYVLRIGTGRIDPEVAVSVQVDLRAGGDVDVGEIEVGTRAGVGFSLPVDRLAGIALRAVELLEDGQIVAGDWRRDGDRYSRADLHAGGYRLRLSLQRGEESMQLEHPFSCGWLESADLTAELEELLDQRGLLTSR